MVTIVSVQRFGAEAVELTYKTLAGIVATSHHDFGRQSSSACVNRPNMFAK